MKKMTTIVLGLAFILQFVSCDKNKNKTEQPTFTANSASKYEGNALGSIKFDVKLSAEYTDVVTVKYATADNAANAGEDYVAASGTLTFAVGETTKSIEIEIKGDSLKEPDEDFLIIFSAPSNCTLTTESITGTIRNDDDFIEIPEDGYITPEAYAGYTKVWSDEFNGTSVDNSAWTFETGNSGWGNNELQYYTQGNNVSLNSGKLVIEARKENFGGAEYTSTRMVTAGKKEFQFGRIDIRAKLPKGQGIWPALWMLGSNISTISWPACGEIDIMELVGHEPKSVHGTVHFGPNNANHVYVGNAYTLTNGEDFSDKFHVFSLVWKTNSIKFYMDDIEYFTVSPTTTGSNNYPFNQAFFFIFNIAVGGQWPGNPDATTVFPQYMYVDYVRVFQ